MKPLAIIILGCSPMVTTLLRAWEYSNDISGQNMVAKPSYF